MPVINLELYFVYFAFSHLKIVTLDENSFESNIIKSKARTFVKKFHSNNDACR